MESSEICCRMAGGQAGGLERRTVECRVESSRLEREMVAWL